METDCTAAARTQLDQPPAPARVELDRLSALQAENERLERCLAETRAEVATLAARAQDGHCRLEALLSSRSWLLTAPLRQAITLLRSIASFRKALRRRARRALIRARRRRAEQRNEQAELNRLGELARQLIAAELFDFDWYLQQNPDVVATRQDPAIHYLLYGSMQGRRPVPWFDPAWYRARNQDAVAQGFEPLTHYHFHGRVERRHPCAEWTQILGQRRISALGLGQPIRRTKLALGILTYNNSAPEVERCLSSVRIAIEQLGPSCETVVLMLDNGEPRTVDPSPMLVLRTLDPVGNIGFGAGHNRLMSVAFADASVDYYLTVNPDGAFEPNALKALIEMGQACGGNALIEALQFPTEHPKHYDHAEFDTAWASGASLMIPRRVYEAIGGFDESFFMYCEDVDLSWRARAAGFDVKTCTRALFFQPPDDREHDPVTRARVLLSGITLARKLGGLAFASKLQNEASSLGLDMLAAPDVALFRGRREVASFEHGFDFAPTRWAL